MGALLKLTDAILFLFFLLIAIVAPLLDAQTCLPESLFPDILLDLHKWYGREVGDYLVVEKPLFYVGFVWLEILFLWPLSILNLYGIVAAKSWFNTTCLIYGVSVATSMAAIMSEVIGSGKASDNLLMVYFPFVGLGLLAILRGLLPYSTKTTSNISKRPAFARKKRA
ncbi:sigma intracellular receptor 2-like [Rhodamnia argentea]|uniref:Sigma intracellular receptor 2-like n=1 Tax=Rhodamnia argentea TaxID=178133 RepID=A0A8B8QGH6_9MYRT|nr:sigma intracellular receptor 2-like [Rhodamnia argentea]